MANTRSRSAVFALGALLASCAEGIVHSPPPPPCADGGAAHDEPDAGAPPDAGVDTVDAGDDAGTLDAGTSDAGPKAVHLTPFATDAGSLADALEREAFLYLPPGDYTLDRTASLNGRRGSVVLGAGRGATRVHLQGHAGIVVTDTQNLFFGNMQVDVQQPDAGDDIFHVTGSAPSQIAFASLLMNGGNVVGSRVVGRTAFRVDGPSDVTLQGVHLGACDQGVLVDYPAAVVHLIGGNQQANNTHVRQKRGRLDMRAVSLQIAFDNDIEIQSGTGAAPHVVEACRSEGPNAFLVVPTTTDHVDMLAQANSMPAAMQGIRYGGGGTLWAINNSFRGTLSATSGAVKSFGNAFDEGSTPTDRVMTAPFAISGSATVSSVGDLLAVKGTYMGTPYYQSTLVSPTVFAQAQLAAPSPLTMPAAVDPADVPAVAPKVTAIDWPYVDNLVELMPSVKDFGAVGDGATDDTAALEAAFAASRRAALYFPPGNYRVSRHIALAHWFGSTFWGEGPDTSVLTNAGDDTVLATNGCGYTSFIGLGFRTHAHGGSPNVDLTWDGSATADSGGGALQANFFYRTAFSGGSQAVSIGDNGYMGSEHLFIHSRFEHASVGLATHNYNALMDVVVDSDFTDDNVVAEQAPSGNFHLYGNRFTRIANQGFSFSNTAWDTFVIRDSEWPDPAYFLGTGFTGARIQLLISNVTFANLGRPDDATAFYYGAGGSLTLFGVDMGDRVLDSYSCAVGEGTVVVLDGKSALANPYFATRSTAHLFK